MRREAHLLSQLLQQHADDTQSTRKSKVQFLHFVDAHELKAYLRADDPQFLHGFMLEAEAATCEPGRRSDLDTVTRLKSERVLNWLLFEQPQPVVLLPPHAEEIDYEISYLRTEQLKRNLGLVSEARRQLIGIKSRSLPHDLMIKSAEAAERGDPQSREDLLRFLYQAAPAVAALLDLTDDEVGLRVAHLIRDSRLVPLELLDWEALGVTGDLARRCRELQPTDSQVDQWRRILASSRSNTLSANRVDAEAIAYLCALNELLRASKSPVHPVLVTRAMTLLHALRHEGAPERQLAVDSVRHTRLLCMPELSAETRPVQRGTGAELPDVLKSLSLALQNYEKQLVMHSGEATDLVAQDAQSLVAAWHQFEGGRFTLELARSPHDPAAETSRSASLGEAVRRLLEWLRGEPNLEAIVTERLQRDLRAFDQDTYSKHSAPLKPLQGRGRWLEGRSRIEIQPAAAFFAGPVVLTQPSLAAIRMREPPGASPAELLSIEIAPTGMSEDPSETYLIWSLLNLCNGRNEPALLYADSAIASARLQRSAHAEREGHLLAAQVLRLWGMAPGRTGRPHRGSVEVDEQAVRRLKRAEQHLENGRFGGDWRPRLERCALDLERALLRRTAGDLNEMDLASALAPLEQCFDAFHQVQTMMAIRASELALLLCMLAYKIRPNYRGDAQGIWHSARQWQRRLVDALTGVRGEGGYSVGDISRTARAVEIIGYSFVATMAAKIGAAADDGVGAIPSALMVDVNETSSALMRCPDLTSAFVRGELNAVISATSRARDFNLVYAPVWEQAHVEAVLNSIEDPTLRTLALRANATVHDVGDLQRVLAGDDAELARLQTAIEQFKAVLQALPMQRGDLDFYLRMELFYAQLLIARIARDDEDQKALLSELADRYEALAQHYPGSSMPHYRRSVVLGELQRGTEALASLVKALELHPTDASLRHNNWFRGTIRRRMGYHLALEAAKVRVQLKDRPGDQELQRRYLQGVQDAFHAVFDEFTDSKGEEDYRALIDQRRRLNNIVYYSSLFALEGGDLDRLHPEFDRETLADFVRKLHPEGLGQVLEWNIVHTIGTAYHALDNSEMAYQCADRLWELMSGRPESNLRSPAVQQAFDDALQWKAARSTLRAAL